MEKNNGKIAIAIVAMLVVALSIVGITYAYFTASVQGNTNTSVNVTAGILEVNYETSSIIDASNVVPGWISDNNHYYDPVASVYTPAETDVNNNGVYDADVEGETPKVDATTNENVKAIKAVTVDPAPTNASIAQPGKTDGKTPAAAFTVANTSRNTGDTTYIINLIVEENGIQDKDNLIVTLYKGSIADGSKLWSGKLANTGETQTLVTDVETIEKEVTAPVQYYVVLEYKNVNSDQTKTNDVSSTGQSISAKIEVVGAVTNDNGASYVDANNSPIKFAQ